MAFDAGTLVATLRLEGKGQFDSELSDTGRKFGQTSSVAQKAGQAVSAALKGAALATGAATAASAAYVASLFRTGIAYNTLQQSSRAALNTILGGTQQANAQMDKLDDFARNSPFAKSVFIQAQQQLLGFGLEAKKVIPALSAIQDTIAAVGGSNEQISQVTYALAQMRGQGKLTGETLNQLGQYGIDAATIIGQKMGKTGGEIRDMASKPGGIPADEVWDILIDSLTEKFGGAAANVKSTFTGTIDRIKAASRDIGAALAEPFVSKNGGGLFVTWGNQVADVMRAVQGHVGPVVGVLEQRALPAFSTITEVLDRARVIVKAWDSSRLNTQLDAMGRYAPAIAAVGGAIAAVNLGFLQSIPVLGRFVPAIAPLPAALLGIAAASPEVRAAGKDLLAALQPLLKVGADLARVLAGDLNAVLPVVAGGIKVLAGVVKPMVDMLAAVPGPVLAGVAAFLLLHKGLGVLTPMISSAQLALKNLAERAAVQQALAGMEGNTSRLAGSFGVASMQAQGLGASLKAAFISNPVGLALTVIAGAVGIFTAALSAAQQKTEQQEKATRELRGTLNETTGSFTDASRAAILNADAYTKVQDSVAKAKISGTEWADAVMKGGASLSIVNGRLRSYAAEQLRASSQSKNLTDLSRILGVSTDTLSGHLLGQKDATREVNRAIADNRDEYTEWAGTHRQWGTAMRGAMSESISMADALKVQRDAARDALDQQKALAEETQKAAAAMGEAGRSNARLNEALTILRDTSKSAQERLSALKQALDELKGGAKSQAEATRDLNEQIDSLASAFAQTDENGTRLALSLVDASGKIDTTTAAGRALFDQVGNLNDQMLVAQQLAYDNAITAGKTLPEAYQAAVDAATPYQDALRKVGEDANLSDEQIRGMIRAQLDVPEVTAYLITDNGSVDIERQKALTLAQQILATPDKDFTVSSDDFPGLYEALRVLGVDITSLPAGRVKVQKDDGSFWSVESALQQLSRARSAVIYTDVQYSAIAKNIAGTGFGFRANGGFDVKGIPAFANGGMQSFASGGFPSGIYAGRPGGLIKFAEPETNWEAYISGKVGQEARNRRVLELAAQRLGMATIPLSRPQTATTVVPAAQDAAVSGGTGTGMTVNIVNPVEESWLQSVRKARGMDLARRAGGN